MQGEAMADRTLELILYVAKHSSKKTVYWVLKAIYFADQQHLVQFGRRLHDDSYVAMEDGPVASHAYDLFKNVKFERRNRRDYSISKGQFDVDQDTIVPLRDPDLRVLSKSEISCLDQAIKTTSKLSFKKLRDLSHDAAWKAASTNRFMDIEDIVKATDGGADAWPYLQERMLA